MPPVLKCGVALTVFVIFAALSFAVDDAKVKNAVRVNAYICTDGLKKCRKPQKAGFVPADVVVEAVVPLHKDNRQVRIGLFCPELGDMNVEPSPYQIEGAQGRTLYRLELRRVTYPCEYFAAALVDSATSTRGTDTQRLVILGR